MNISLDAKSFSAAMREAAKLAASKTTLPILSHVRLDAGDGALRIVATDFDTFLEIAVPAEVEEPGTLCAPASVLAQFAAAAKGERIEMRRDGHALRISCGRSRIGAATLDAADFPAVNPPADEAIGVDGPTFSAALRHCIPAVSDDDGRAHLGGVFVGEGVEHEGFTLYATDGHRLHWAEIVGHASVGGGGILPTRAAEMIAAMCESKGGEPKIRVTPRAWFAEAGDRRAWGKMVEGSYPEARRIIARFPAKQAACADTAELQRAASVAIIGSEKFGRTVLIEGEGETLVLYGAARGSSSSIADAGEAVLRAEIAEPFFIAVNAEYLTAALAAIGGDSVAISVSGPNALALEPVAQGSVLRRFTMVMGMREERRKPA